MTKLTLRQQEVLNLLIDYQRKHGSATTYELTGMLGCRSQCGGKPPEGTGEKRGHHNHPRVSRGISITPSFSRKELVVNLNSIVKVKLNEVSQSFGKTTRREPYTLSGDIRRVCTVGDRRYGYSSMTLWRLMSDLGQLCYCGGHVPFELKLILEDE